MPIRFRCRHCSGLMSISTRKIGATIDCPTCAQPVVVPAQDDLGLPGGPRSPVTSEPALPPGRAAVDEPAVATPALVPPPQPASAEEALPAPAWHRLAPEVERRFELATPPRAAVFVEPQPSPRDADEDVSVEPSFAATSAASDVDEDDDDDDVSFPRGASRFEEDELDLTAMVDVVFQLLIFFMVTASFSLQKTIEVPTPDQPRQGVAQALQPLEELQDVAILVNIDDRNAVTIDDEPLGDLTQLTNTLRDHMRRDRKSELILTAAKNSTHRTVIAVVDSANEAGMQRIRMATSRAVE
jgi:biopolymer transport protein ExbD